MKTSSPQSEVKAALTIRVHLTDGSSHSYSAREESAARKIWDAVDPARLFTAPRIVVGSEHSKAVFVTCEINRVDFVQDCFQCWQFPAGYSDVVELTETEFRAHAHLDEPELMVKRAEPTPVGDLLVSFVQLHLRGGQKVFTMVEAPVKLPAESQTFMQFMLSKGAIHMRLRGGGTGILNLANLAGYIVYPGVAQIPGDSWLAEPYSD
jgi:hypothetical protein